MKMKLEAEIAVYEQHQFDLVYYKFVHQRVPALLTNAKNYSGKIIKVSNINQFMCNYYKDELFRKFEGLRH